MAPTRLRAVLFLLVLTVLLTTAGCRGVSGRGGQGTGHGTGQGTGHGGGLSSHLPWFSSSREPDPMDSIVAELHREAADSSAVSRAMDSLTHESWVAPLAGPIRVTRPFQPPPSPYAAGHRGVDLAGSPRQRVRAAGDGTVTWAGLLAGRGVVVVSHGSLRTTYEPVAAEVAEGRLVRAGDEIATLQPGHPGCPVAACLHWGLLRGSAYLDPMLLIRPYVRLLPQGNGT